MTVALPPLSARQWLASMALACLAAVAAALLGQHLFDMRPCPWCILQRFLFVLIGLICAIGALVPARPVHLATALTSVALALAGGAAALWQHFVAARSDSCNLTLADKVINTLGLESIAPALFQVTASCADAAVSVLGVPFEVWSLALFAALALAAIASLRRTG